MTRSLPYSSLRRRRRLALLVLPALLLRALIPAGFMPLAGADGPYLGFCPGAGELPPQWSERAPQSQHGAHAHHGAGSPHAPEIAHHPACVFSSGASTAFAAPLFAAHSVPVFAAPAQCVVSLTFLPAIQRAQSPRAPPVLA